MKRCVVFFHLILILFITGCNNEMVQINSGNESELEEEPNKELETIIFPEVVDLTFSEVPLEALQIQTPSESLEFLEKIHLGELAGEEVSLQVYKEGNVEKACGEEYETVSFLQLREQSYKINQCTSTSLVEQSEYTEGYLLMNDSDKEFNRNNVIYAAVELAANGPNRMLYLVHNESSREWFSFEAWGIPLLTNLDNSGDKEFINQFPGMHMSRPDVTIYKWMENKLMGSEQLSEKFIIPNSLMTDITMEQLEDGYVVSISVLTENQEREHIARYEYTGEKLVLVGKPIMKLL